VSTERLYRDDPYVLEFDARVVARRDHAGQPAVVLDRTAFYAESGGQPWDTGALNGVPVVAVVEIGDEVLHVLSGALASETVHGRVDAARRNDHRQQHHGQHLLSRAFVELARAKTVSFHLGADSSSIDLDRDVTDADVRVAERRTNEVVWSARPVVVRIVTAAEAKALGIPPPAGAADTIRLVEAEGFDVQPCGGTHPRNTAEVGVVVVLGRERYKGGSRVRFVCGERAVEAFREKAATLDRLGALFSAPLGGVADAAQRALDDLAVAQKRIRDLSKLALETEAQRLLAGVADARPVIVARFEGRSPEDLRTLALALVASRPCIALLGTRADKAHLVFAQSEGLFFDLQALLREAAALLGGRGGGKGNLAQGGGERVEQLDEALARAAAAVRSA
jgi:alanyl-tRNA synthetase